MGRLFKGLVFALCLLVASDSNAADADDNPVSALPASYEITTDIIAVHRGYHELSNLTLEYRVFEKFGLTVAMNPTQLVLVVSNIDPEPPSFGAWSLGIDVSKVLRVKRSTCGVNIDAIVDYDTSASGRPLTKRVRYKICFVDAEKRLTPPTWERVPLSRRW